MSEYEVTASRLDEMATREKVRETLGLEHHSDFSIMQWLDPRKVSPEDATFVVIKDNDPDVGIICYEVAFENGQYWLLLKDSNDTVPLERILGWSYPPHDDRVDTLGRYRPDLT